MGTGELNEDPEEQAAFRRLLAERLPRHRAPAHLRDAVVALASPPRRFGGWWAPALSALATALVMALVGFPLLSRSVLPDPLQLTIRAVLAEHTRSALWGQPRPEAVPAALPRLMEETGIALTWFFGGDDEVQLINVRPLIVEGRRALALTYKDSDGHLVTYLLVPGAEMAVPDQGRVQIDRFRPLLTRVNGFSLLVWKQQGLACFLMSDMVSEGDLSRFKQLFLKVRLASEPVSIN